MQADYLGFVTELRSAHGDLARMRILGEEAWELMSPDLVREALVTHADKLIRWERGIEVFRHVFGDSVLTSEHATWQRQRRTLAPAFTSTRVAGYAALMTGAGQRLLGKAIPDGARGASVPIERLWNGITMEVIMGTLFSSSAEAEAADAAWATQVLSAAAFREMFLPFTLPSWLPLPGKASKRRALAILRKLIRDQVAARRAEGEQRALRSDLLDMLLTLRDEATGQGLSEQEVLDQCMVMFQAGHETGAAALQWWTLLMAEQPDALLRAQDEVDRVLNGAVPGAEDAARLPWLTATLKESMRLYPPVAALMTRRTTAPLTLGGHAIPAGAMLRITPWVLHRDARWFPEPERFMPERFMDGAAPIPKGAWIPFGIGPRVCIGQQFVMLEMTLLAAMFLQAYVPALDADAKPFGARMHVTLRPDRPMTLRLMRRAG